MVKYSLPFDPLAPSTMFRKGVYIPAKVQYKNIQYVFPCSVLIRAAVAFTLLDVSLMHFPSYMVRPHVQRVSLI